MHSDFELLLFVSSVRMTTAAERAGIDAVIVDWEWRGKAARQAGFDTEINRHTFDLLRAVRATSNIPVVCRVNGFGEWTAAEVKSALDAGADEILLPMVRKPDEVCAVLDLVGGRCAVSILLETVDAVDCASALARLPLRRVYAGLNDLAIERGSNSIFDAVHDGTIDRIRPHFACHFGFGGLTVPDKGFPVPCRLLISEMNRLRCSFSFLRRSFLRDVPLEQFPRAVAQIREAIDVARRWPSAPPQPTLAEVTRVAARLGKQ